MWHKKVSQILAVAMTNWRIFFNFLLLFRSIEHWSYCYNNWSWCPHLGHCVVNLLNQLSMLTWDIFHIIVCNSMDAYLRFLSIFLLSSDFVRFHLRRRQFYFILFAHVSFISWHFIIRHTIWKEGDYFSALLLASMRQTIGLFFSPFTMNAYTLWLQAY